MGEQKAIENSRRLTTRDSLAADLRALGVDRGMTLLLHSSLSTLGWVCGGAQAVIEAVMDVLGPSGNLVVPAQSGGLSDPANWKAPPVPQAWWQTIRDTMPAYDPARTPTRNMGAIPELFRTWPGAMRSAHPADSFAASGPNAPTIIEPHALDDPFGEGTPLSRLYDMGASVLLAGVSYDRCTALHLAERRAEPDAPVEDAYAPVMVNGERRWTRYRMPAKDSDRFPAIGAWIETEGAVTHGTLGMAQSRLIAIRKLVDLGTEWLRQRA